MATPGPFAPSGLDFFEPEEWEPMTPLPPFEQPPERPLFADEVRREPVPAAVAPTPPAPTPPTPTPSEPAPIDVPRRRRGLKALLLSLVAIAVAVAMYVAFLAGKDDDPGSNATPNPSTSSSATAPATSSTQKPAGAALKIADIGDFDPEGDPQSESPGRVGLAIDGKPATAWPTAAYPDANFGSAVSGVGLIVDLGAKKSISSIEIQVIGQPTDVSFYASAAGADEPPAELADATELGRVAGAGTSATIEVPTTTRYLIVWLTKLPADGSHFRGQIAEITVRS